MSVPESRYPYLPEKIKLKRAKMFVKLVTLLEINVIDNPETPAKIWDYIDTHMLEDDLEYMTIEDILLLRNQGFADNSIIFDLFPEEFDFLEGIPVLMWDQL